MCLSWHHGNVNQIQRKDVDYVTPRLSKEIFSTELHFRFSHVQLKNAYAVSKLRKSGYSKQKFYNEAVNMYKEVCFWYVLEF